MATTIEEFAAERGISLLFHFTKASNLSSILERGLVTRDILRREGNDAAFNDQIRLDDTDAICASISFPNYKMFWSLRQSNPGTEWVILAIWARALWQRRCAFCQANAASAGVSNIPLQQRMTLGALERMYADFGERQRATLNIPNNFPTNPQAEVLLLDGLPREYIAGVLVPTNAMKTQLEASHPGWQIRHNTTHYSYRSDYEYWK